MTWDQLCTDEKTKNRWVALEDCRCDQVSGRVLEGSLVDADKDVVALCNRIRDAEYKHCTIVYCARPVAAARGAAIDPFRTAAH